MSTPIYLSLAPARPLVSVVIRGPAGPAGPTGPAAGDPADLAESIHSADPLLAPADTDELAAATPGTPSLLKRIPWAALKAALAAHFDPTYLPLARRHAYAAPYSYCGRAPAGTAESAAAWTITRITVATDGSVTTATATDVAWSDYLTATYA